MAVTTAWGWWGALRTQGLQAHCWVGWRGFSWGSGVVGEETQHGSPGRRVGAQPDRHTPSPAQGAAWVQEVELTWPWGGHLLQALLTPPISPHLSSQRLLFSSRLPNTGGWGVHSRVQRASGSGRWLCPQGPPPRTGIAPRTLPARPHQGPGGAAGGDGGRQGVHLRLGDGVLPHHALQPPRQVGLGGAPSLTFPVLLGCL